MDLLLVLVSIDGVYLGDIIVLKILGAYFQKIIKIKRGKSLAIKGFYLFVQFYLYSLIIS